MVSGSLRLRGSSEYDHSNSEAYVLATPLLNAKTIFDIAASAWECPRIDVSKLVIAIETEYFSRNLKNSLAPNILCKVVLILIYRGGWLL